MKKEQTVTVNILVREVQSIRDVVATVVNRMQVNESDAALEDQVFDEIRKHVQIRPQIALTVDGSDRIFLPSCKWSVKEALHHATMHCAHENVARNDLHICAKQLCAVSLARCGMASDPSKNFHLPISHSEVNHICSLRPLSLSMAMISESIGGKATIKVWLGTRIKSL